MRVLVVVEGSHEAGGALEAILGRLTDGKLQMELDRLANNNIHLHHGHGQGYYKKAVRWLREEYR